MLYSSILFFQVCSCSQMVPCSSVDKDMKTAEVSESCNTLSQQDVLDKITSYADLQQNWVVAQWKINEAHMGVLHELGIMECNLSSADDLTALYYLALDCGVLASLDNGTVIVCNFERSLPTFSNTSPCTLSVLTILWFEGLLFHL